MGKTSKPLTLLVDSRIKDWPELQALEAQGHALHWYEHEGWDEYDIVLGPTCHRMSEHERPWLDEAIKEARRLKYGGKT